MKTIILMGAFLMCSCGTYRITNDNGTQYYIDSKNYPFVISYVAWDEKDYLYHAKNYSFGFHLKDSFPVGDTLYLTNHK